VNNGFGAWKGIVWDWNVYLESKTAKGKEMVGRRIMIKENRLDASSCTRNFDQVRHPIAQIVNRLDSPSLVPCNVRY
jgi:hypothetical protein